MFGAQARDRGAGVLLAGALLAGTRLVEQRHGRPLSLGIERDRPIIGREGVGLALTFLRDGHAQGCALRVGELGEHLLVKLFGLGPLAGLMGLVRRRPHLFEASLTRRLEVGRVLCRRVTGRQCERSGQDCRRKMGGTNASIHGIQSPP